MIYDHIVSLWHTMHVTLQCDTLYGHITVQADDPKMSQFCKSVLEHERDHVLKSCASVGV